MTIQEMRQKKRELGITYEQIAQRCGLSGITVQRIMNGTTENPRQYTLDRLAWALTQSEVREEAFKYGYSDTDRGLCSAEDYYKLPEDEHCELIDGRIYDMASPSDVHQDILMDLAMQLYMYVKQRGGSCRVRMAPSDVKLDEITVVQPDVYIICKPRTRKDAPDFIAEVVSPSTKVRDYIIKLNKYKERGVREYWIVDKDRGSIKVYLFEADDFTLNEYSFNDPVPVNIWCGECVVDLSSVGEEEE